MIIKSRVKGFKLPGNIANNFKGDDRRKRIAITPFEILDNYDTFPNINYNDKVINLKYAVINTDIMFNILFRMSYNSRLILIAMINSLEPNSNIINFKITEYAKNLAKTPSNIYNGYKDLFDYNIIYKTNKQSTYIINHNLCFKGNLNEFIKDYREIYKDNEPIINDKNEIVIQ